MDFDPYGSHWRENVPPMTLLETSWEMTSHTAPSYRSA